MADPTLDSFSILITNPLLQQPNFTPDKSTWDNLKFAGKLVLIQDANLIDSLFVYHNHIEQRTIHVQEGMQTYTRNTIGPYLIHFDNLQLIPDGSKGKPRKKPTVYSEQIAFNNMIQLRKMLLRTICTNYSIDKATAKALIQMIDRNLNSFPSQ